ncbi:hypothetical protein DFH11DRAFT_1624235 [Phellopilus nigrolimitatus]|nr:hypothetical protein DFH11DRAFT_1624235 [Phellopilus nigrolimitatus]
MLELLNQLDGFDTGGEVKVIMAMNRIAAENFPGFADNIMGPELMDKLRARLGTTGLRL